MIKLYHYSNSDFKGYIKPDFFGSNTYTGNSARISGVKRIYFYTDRQSREIYLTGVKYRYIAEISEKKLYNLISDPKNLAEKLKGKDIFWELKKRGYNGLIGDNGFKCICLFKAVKIKDRQTLTS